MAKDMDPSPFQDPEIYIESRPRDPRYSLTVGKWMIIPLKLTIIHIYIFHINIPNRVKIVKCSLYHAIYPQHSFGRSYGDGSSYRTYPFCENIGWDSWTFIPLKMLQALIHSQLRMVIHGSNQAHYSMHGVTYWLITGISPKRLYIVKYRLLYQLHPKHTRGRSYYYYHLIIIHIIIFGIIMVII